ncbi:hypothetical protein PGB90_001925 [Kerria lacca]
MEKISCEKVSEKLSILRQIQYSYCENGAWWTRIGSELEFALSNENVSLSSNTFIVLPATSSELFIKRQFYRMMPTFKLNATMKSDFEGGSETRNMNVAIYKKAIGSVPLKLSREFNIKN